MKHNIRVVLCATLALFAVLGGYLLYVFLRRALVHNAL